MELRFACNSLASIRSCFFETVPLPGFCITAACLLLDAVPSQLSPLSPTRDVFTNGMRNPFGCLFRYFQRLIMTLLSHPLLRMPTCRAKKDRAVTAPRSTMHGTDIRTHCKANCTCTVQRTIRLRGMRFVAQLASTRF
ncbi:hypothetical protein CJF32_00011267 [Rutstroemia sp. NJR-2017a WRK4]|nr:hypothetical protein CJF32_00011267 [Rutstroemia sp. NJR-2017a WRK4]